MSRSNFTPSMGIVLQHGGGFTDDRRDPGNWTGGKVGKGKLLGTKYGIASNSFPNLDIKNLSQAQAVDIYQRKYANPVRFDDLPNGVDYAVLDLAINSGVAKANIVLEQALANLGQHLRVDGVIDDETLAALYAVQPAALIDEVCDARLAYMRKLKNWPTYKNGWTRRVAEVRKASKGMVVGRPLGLPSVDPAPSARGANAMQVAMTKIAGVKESILTAVGIVGDRSADVLAQLQPFADVGMIRTVCTVLTVVSVGYGLYRLVQANKVPSTPAPSAAA